MDEKEIYVTKPSMPPYEEFIDAIRPLWSSYRLTNMGKYHQELERRLKEYLDVQELTLMVNGHMALELALQAFDFPKKGEVITTPFTFISTTHAIIRNQLKPIFCDVKEKDGTIDETKLEGLITERTVAILPVHVYGNVCNIEEIQRIADKYNLKVIYDAAHAFGVRYKEHGIGSYGDASIFSFHATKVFNTVEGGAVSFHDRELYEKLYNLKNFGIRGEELVTEVGANAKMNEFCAVMGLCNLKYVDGEIEKRKEKYLRYKELLGSVAGLRFLDQNSRASANYAYIPLIVEENYKKRRNDLYESLRLRNVHARKYFYPLTCDAVCFGNRYISASLENARRLSSQVLALPLYSSLEEKEIDRITNIIKEH